MKNTIFASRTSRTKSGRGAWKRLTLYLRQAPLLLLRVLSDPPQVFQLCLQELALPCSLQPQVALLRKLRLQLADTPPQRLTQATALMTEWQGERLKAFYIDFFVSETWRLCAPHLQPERLELFFEGLDLPRQLFDQTISDGHGHNINQKRETKSIYCIWMICNRSILVQSQWDFSKPYLSSFLMPFWLLKLKGSIAADVPNRSSNVVSTAAWKFRRQKKTGPVRTIEQFTSSYSYIPPQWPHSLMFLPNIYNPGVLQLDCGSKMPLITSLSPTLTRCQIYSFLAKFSFINLINTTT